MSEQLVTPENVTTKDGKINLLDLNRQQMREFFKDLGEKPFRADQVMKWMYHYCCDNFDEMTDINKVLRGKLKEVAEIRAPEVVEEQRSSDGTIKWAIAVGDQRVETVYIPEDDRATLCVSSQVGCALECKFCSTAQQGFNRNLRVSEIIGQVWRAAKIVGAAKVTGQRPITNVVMMGMGEPLLNLNNVVPAMEIMLDDFGFGLSKRRVTLSTSGVVPALDKLGDMIDVALAISLHAPNDEIRDEIVPINKKYNIETFLAAVRRYLESEGFPVYDCDSRTKALYDAIPGLKARIEVELGISWSQIGVIFADAARRQKLESIVYPFVVRDILEWKSGLMSRLAFIESAVAMDKREFDGLYDEVLLVDAPAAARFGRNPKAAQRDSLQSFDRARVSYIIENDSTIEELHKKTDQILCRLI